MKIYTEIVYKWDEEKGELVEESSISYDYVGPVSQCHTGRFPHPHGGVAGDIYNTATDIVETVVNTVTGGGKKPDLTGVLSAGSQFGGIKPPIWMTDPRGTVTEALETAADTTTSNLEGIIEDNNDSLADLESGINTTISDTVENVEQGVENLATVGDAGVSIINMTSDIAHQGLDASVNINNPQSLLSNPSKWWELNTEGAASGDWFFDSEEAKDSMAGKGADVLSDAFEPMYDWLSEGVAGVSDTFVGIGESLGSQFLRGKSGLQGDPFGLEGPRRRDILEKKTFKDRGGAIAPSRINQGGYGNMG